MDVPTTRSQSNNNIDELSSAPPSYTSIVYKIDEHEFDHNPPPSYSDIGNSSIIYINNYPGPPLADGVVQVITESTSINNVRLSKSICIYLICFGIITLLCGLATIGLQIGMIVQHSNQYYYYGFWGGIVLISIGLNILSFYRHRYTITKYQIFRSSIWQMLSVLIIFAIGIVILITDKCQVNQTGDDQKPSCRTLKIFNGFLFGIFAFQLAFSISNLLIFSFLKREQI